MSEFASIVALATPDYSDNSLKSELLMTSESRSPSRKLTELSSVG